MFCVNHELKNCSHVQMNLFSSGIKSSAHYLWSEVQWNYVMQCDEMLKLSCTATAVLTYIPDQSFHTWSMLQTNLKRQDTSVIQKIELSQSKSPSYSGTWLFIVLQILFIIQTVLFEKINDMQERTMHAWGHTWFLRDFMRWCWCGGQQRWLIWGHHIQQTICATNSTRDEHPLPTFNS